MQEYTEITHRSDGAVATITLNRPDKGNGFTHTMAGELVDALTQADEDDDVRAVVLTGSGRHFCVGADLSGGGFKSAAQEKGGTEPKQKVDPAAWREPAGVVTMRMLTMNTPVIAAINGNAVGAGISLTLAADFRFLAESAKVGFVFVRRGITPEGGSHWFLPRIVGLPTALDWILTGRLVEAREALTAGLVRSVHPAGEVVPAAQALAHEIAENTAPVAVAVARQMLYRMSPLPDPQHVHEIESRLIQHLTRRPDAREGVASFMERRRAVFPDRVTNDLPQFLPWVSDAAH